MNILLIILILLVVTRTFGELAERGRLPALVGELVAGIFLGYLLQRFQALAPSVWFAANSEIFAGLADLGMFFLMLLAGIRMEPLDFARSSKSAVLIALGGMALPVGIGFFLGQAILPESDYKNAQALFIGVALAITAVPVAVRIFMDLDALETRIGKAVIAAALWDDVLSLLLMALLLAAIGSQATGSFSLDNILPVIGKVLLFFVITIPVGLYVFPLIGKSFRHLSFPEVDFSMLLIGALSYAVLAEVLDLHLIIGAFMAGMFFHPKVVERGIYDRVEQQMSGLTRGFLAPIFFVSVGFHLDFSSVAAAPGFVVVLTALALASKLIGSGIPAYWTGFTKRESLLVGVGMSGRGAVELVIAGVALEAGLFLQPDPPGVIVQSLFSAIVIMAIVTTVATPIALRLLWKK
ncbi:MAG: cation:proton antiporter [Woeseiaceae bacterium]|nr:cation:proton antiporter [Woeseiaceae bacterium]